MIETSTPHAPCPRTNDVIWVEATLCNPLFRRVLAKSELLESSVACMGTFSFAMLSSAPRPSHSNAVLVDFADFMSSTRCCDFR